MTTEEETIKSLGQRLREERESQEVSLEEISRVTKISIHLLHAMENDEWDSLPGGIFTRNFIRLYTGHLGLETEEWVGEYRQFIKAKRHEAGIEDEDEKALRPQIDVPKAWLYGLLVAVIVMLVGGFFAISYFKPFPDQNEPVDNRVGDASIGAGGQADGLLVELINKSETACRYKYFVDNDLEKPEFEGALEKGSKKLYAKSRIKLYITRIEGIDIRVNRKDVGWEDFKSEETSNRQGNYLVFVFPK